MRGTVNKVILIGRLGRDPDMRYTPSGMATASFSIATNSRAKDPEGNFIDHTDWHNIVMFGKLAEIAGEYLKKGKLVYLEGRLRTRSWEDQNGVKQYRTEVVANNMVMLGPKGEPEIEPPVTEDTTPATEATDAADEPPVEDEDDLPF